MQSHLQEKCLKLNMQKDEKNAVNTNGTTLYLYKKRRNLWKK